MRHQSACDPAPNRALTLVAALSCALAGCAAHPARVHPVDPGGCPPALREGVALSASVAQIGVPAGLSVPSGPVPLIAGAGRRVLLAVQVGESVPSVQLLSNSLSLLTYGGVLAGWAQIESPASSASEGIQAQGGWLHIAPFISGSRLHARTQAVDLLVIPGGHPVAGLALQPGPMWRPDGEPVPPHQLRIRPVPEFHMTRFNEVDATATLRFGARHLTGAHERWQCEVATNFALVDHSAELPDLWILRGAGSHASQRKTLALYSRHMGTFAAVFLDPQTARSFALWVVATHATRAGQFALRLIGSPPHSAVTPLSPGTAEALAVAQWGSK